MFAKFAKAMLLKAPLVKNYRERLARCESRIDHLRAQYNHLRMAVAESHLAAHGDKLLEILALLKPRRVVGLEKTRVGVMADGGYVMLDDFAHVPSAYSLGICDEVSWDLAMAGRGISVRQFDYSIDKSPVQNRLFTFHKRKIDSMADLGLTREPRQVLKIDIEGSEWDFFARASPGELALFQQITGEFHDFDRFYEPAWQQRTLLALRTLNETHQLIHLHGNNLSPSFYTGRLQLPVALELSYVLKSAYKFADTTETFPGPLDCPNNSGRPDFAMNAVFA